MPDTAIQLTKLRLDGGTQPRVKIDTDVVDEYAERIQAGDELPPVEVFHDGAAYWLADGFHRYHGHAKAGKKTIRCNIRKGTVRDAILFSCGANSTHGLQRTTKDKQRAIEILLADDEWVRFSDRKIADICCVSDKTVGAARERRCGNSAPDDSATRRRGSDGKSYPASQPKRPPVTSTADYKLGKRDQAGTTTAVAERPKQANPDTNDIGDMHARIRFAVECETDGKPDYIRLNVADFLEDLAAELRA